MNRIQFRKTISLISALLLVVMLMLTSVSCGEETEESTGLGVIVTIVPQAEFVEKIGGDKVDVTIMVPAGASPHTYEPTPSQMAAVSRAELYATVGSGVEFELTWMDKLIAQNEDMLVIDCSDGIQLREMTTADDFQHDEEHDGHEEEEDDHDHGAMDPHIWMSPANAQTMVKNIADGLILADPDNKDYYEENRDAYLAELEQLDRDIEDGLADIANRIFMVYHPSFGYFADEYNLTMLPVEDEGNEPTPAGLQNLIDLAREYDIHVVFASPQFNPQSADVIADAIDGTVVLIDPLAKEYVSELRTLLSELVQSME